MWGIEFLTEPICGILQNIFSGIDLSLYLWTSESYEAYSSMNTSSMDTRFLSPTILGADFQTAVYSLPEYIIDFAELKGFLPAGKITGIDSYQDFESSDCQIIILICDMRLIEIYAKDLALLEKAYNNVQKNIKYQNLVYKTAETDGRTKMHF